MKNTLLISISIASFCFLSLHAQAQVSIGVKGGVNWSSLNGSNAFNNNTLQYTTYGGFVNFGGLVLSVQPEIMFTQKGGYNYDMIRKTHEEFRFRYVEFPLLLKLGLNTGVVYPHVCVGPYYAAAISKSFRVINASENISPQYKTMNLRDDDIGIIGGAGIDFHIKRIFLTIDGRYALGVRSLDKGGDYDRREIRNGGFVLAAGAGFILKR